MKKHPVLTKSLAVIGMTLAWIPLVAPIVFSLFRLVARGGFHLDYLMPAELFPLALVGAGLLLWAALRARARRAAVGGGFGAMVGGLVGCMVSAAITGLASGTAEPAGWRLVLVMTLLAVYILALIAVAVAGTLLVRDLFAAHGGRHSGAPQHNGGQA